jgi:2-amino-4-hydroxy-6-hydroxymethyldihydropteridine diphosphokinase
METVILLTGSNMGDRLGYLNKACDRLGNLIGRITASSAVYESAPWGFGSTDNFLNQVIAVDTDMQPGEVLTTILSIERSLGRIRQDDAPVCDQNCITPAGSLIKNTPEVMPNADEGMHYQPRTIDIDILFYGQRMIFTENLAIPHPRLHLRKFTLVPLMEIFPDFVHPLLKKNVTELARTCPDLSEVKRVEESRVNDPD